MLHPKIDLKQRRNLGDIITVFFDFFKENLKPFINIFLRYNGIFIIAFLGISYLLVSGFVGVIRASSTYPYDTVANDNGEVMLGLGVLAFFGLFIITAILNYSLAASYMIAYDENKEGYPDNRIVWRFVSSNLGKILIFILLLFLLYIPIIIIGLVISIIPFFGSILQYFIGLIYTAWMGVSFMVMLKENMDVGQALSEGWRLVSSQFWKSVLVNFCISFLLMLLLLVVLMIPGVLISIYVYHSVENSIDLYDSAISSIIWTVTLSIFLVLYTLLQSLSQFTNGILYFSLHEEVYNEAARKRIEQIGASE